jgi:ribonuclease G
MIEKQIIVNHCRSETRIAVLEKEKVAELFVERHADRGLVGNIYSANILRVLPGMQSAFVDIGEMRSGFLYVNDVLTEELLQKSRELLATTTEDMSHEEIQNRIAWTKSPIETSLREGQRVLVQVAKEPLGNKGARLTMFVTLPGRYLVLSPYFGHIGVSKKIENEQERERLRSVVAQLKPEKMAVIVRTAAQGVPASVLTRELEFLLDRWNELQERASHSQGPSLLHRDLELTHRVIRELYSEDVAKIVIDDQKLGEKARRFLATLAADAESKVEIYENPEPIFDVYGIEMDIGRALSRKVDLPSGGYIIVDQTEALTAFDVNTGRYVGKTNAAETVLRTNLEAVRKIVSQLRIRNIGGIIVLDFIDMEAAEDREKVFSALMEELKFDRAKTNVLKISELGLVQMTRKRTSDSLQHLLLEDCPLCEGRGKVKSVVSEAHDLLREIVRIHNQTGRTLLQVRVRDDIRDWILEEERDWFQEIVDRWSLTVNFKTSDLTGAALKEASFEVNAE